MRFLMNLAVGIATTAIVIYTTLLVKVLITDGEGWQFLAAAGVLIGSIVFFLFVWDERTKELRKASRPKDPADLPTQKIR